MIKRQQEKVDGMKQYELIKTTEIALTDGSAWEKAHVADISVYPWGGTYRPKSEARLVYTDDAFYLKLVAIEPRAKMRAEARGISPDVYQDSCLEFFFKPAPDKDPRYVNLEFNPAGALYVGLGTGRQDGRLLKEQDISAFGIETFSEESEDGNVCWGLCAKIPFSFLEEHRFPINFQSGHRMTGNFYKCGDLTQTPHYGVWSPIDWPQPDFHRPEFFSKLVLL